MKARQSYESARVPEFITIIQQGRYAQMIAYLIGLAERAALEAEREAAKAKPKPTKRKRGPKKRRARQA